MISAPVAIVVILIGLVLIAYYFLFRKQQPVHRNFNESWRRILLNKVQFYEQLSGQDRDRFEQSILYFYDDVKITGVEIEVTETDRLLVAASGIIPLFGFPGWRYNNLNEVLLYPDTFNHDYKTAGAERNVIGMVGSGPMNRIMILSLPALRRSFSAGAGAHHVGIHEFVHLLDKADGDTDGVPESLLQQQYLIPWVKEMHEEIKNIQEGNSDIDPYGATNEAEFLSVVSEYFFTQPNKLAAAHPQLFELLETIYRQRF